MNSKPDPRPISPYMLGPYYKFQITSLLSIISRITGLFLAAVTAPLAIIWLLALMTGPEAFAVLQSFMGSIVGKGIALISLFALVYHLLNGLRHLAWDTGRGFEMQQIRTSGYLVVAATVLSVAAIWWAGS